MGVLNSYFVDFRWIKVFAARWAAAQAQRVKIRAVQILCKSNLY